MASPVPRATLSLAEALFAEDGEPRAAEQWDADPARVELSAFALPWPWLVEPTEASLEAGTLVGHFEDCSAPASPLGLGLRSGRPAELSISFDAYDPCEETPSKDIPQTPTRAAESPTATPMAESSFATPPGLPPPAGMPSHGSLMHATGRCKPCAWFFKPAGCANQSDCKHCHLCPEGEIKARKRTKHGQMKAGKGDEPESPKAAASPASVFTMSPCSQETSVGSDSECGSFSEPSTKVSMPPPLFMDSMTTTALSMTAFEEWQQEEAWRQHFEQCSPGSWNAPEMGLLQLFGVFNDPTGAWCEM